MSRDDERKDAWQVTALAYVDGFMDDDDLDSFILKLIRISKRREHKNAIEFEKAIKNEKDVKLWRK